MVVKSIHAGLILGALLTPALSPAGDLADRVSALPPAVIDANRHYLFYLHGAVIETQGLDASHPQYGKYRYAEITQVLSARGFVVISEARLRPVDAKNYAERIAKQVDELVAKGVPPDHITVIGHSKGGQIALLVASMVKKPKVTFVIMAGCPKNEVGAGGSDGAFLSGRAQLLEGRILSLYDRSDRIAGSCRATFAQAAPEATEIKEIVTDTERGHGLFFAPESVWVDEVVAWSGVAPLKEPTGH